MDKQQVNMFQNRKHESGAGFIINIIAIAVILGAVVLSQNAHFKVAAKNMLSHTSVKQNAYLAPVQNWLENNVYDKFGAATGSVSQVGGEVAAKKDAAVAEITNQKDSLQKNSIDSTKKFLAEKILQAIGVTSQELCQP